MHRSSVLSGFILLFCLPAISSVFATDCKTLFDKGDFAGAVRACEAALKSGGTPEDTLTLARAHRGLFELQPMLEAYRDGIRRFGTPDLFRAFTADLLAFDLRDEAGRVVDDGLSRFPRDAALMELKAVSEAYAGRDGEACTWIRRSWAAGADPLSWAENTLFGERASQPPYRDLLDTRRLSADLSNLPEDRAAVRLRLLSSAMTEEAAGPLTDLLLSGASVHIQRLALADLALLKDRALPRLSELLQSPDPSLRRKVLMMLWDLRLPSTLPIVEEYMRHEPDPRNAALADVLTAAMKAMALGDATPLEAISSDNPFHALADGLAEELYTAKGMTEQARSARERALLPPPYPSVIAVEGSGLEAYWECMERQDIRDMLDLLEVHRTIHRVDGRIYGLPQNDFDDRQNLTIAERLFLRTWAREQGLEWPTEGFVQYPREIRHTLRDIYAKTGMLPDCSGKLNDATGCDTESLLVRQVELKLFEDTGGDNEVNIIVNPYAQQYVVATSNAYSSSQNETYRSSDYGKTWTHGAIGEGNNACDPVSFYNRSQTLYHSYLNYSSGVYVSYSTNQGSTWTACAQVATGGVDREDLYIDTFAGDGGSWSASPCVDKVYVGWHLNGAQKFRASSGTSSPFCASWGTAVSLSGNGSASTIGTAIMSSIGKTSGNGTVIDVFSRYTSGPGIFYSLSTNCGGAFGTPALISSTYANAFEWGIPSCCSRAEYIYPQGDSDRQPLSAFRNNLYVVWNDLSSACTPPDCTGNTTCNSDIYLAKGVPDSRDNPTSWTWTTVNLTRDVVLTDNKTDEFYPSLTVDQADGSVYVTYYRSDSGSVSLAARQKQVNYVVLRSINGGATWQSVVKVTAGSTNEYDSGADQSMQWGDYTWNDVINGVVYPCWTDRRETADEDIWSSKICSEPSHWVERGASPAVPPTTATPGAGKVITLSWTLPDLYWGDGGESAATRKFQLYVDGALYQDNIGASTTSTTYTASNCTTSHIFYVRAVNSCSVTKDYAPATATATGCAGANPKEDTSMLAVRGSGTLIQVNYTAGCGATSHAVYWRKLTGGITAPLTWASSACGVTSGSTFDPGTLNAGEWIYFVAVGQNGAKEGSYGQSFNGSAYTEEPEAVGVGTCDLSQDLTGTCP